jgi:TetR/AcrR family transcriptional regulator, cholesterol catabolism regulator
VPRKAPSVPDVDRSDSKSARTRARLLDAAAAVLSRKGFAGTRLSDIAEHAQVQAPAIYYYYSSREDLIEEVMYAGASGMREHLDRSLQALPENTTPAHRLAVAVESHLRHELEVSDYAKAIIRNSNQLPDAVSKRALAEITEYNEIWRDLIGDMCDAGQLREDIDPAVGRMIVLGALNWAAEWWDPARGSLEDLIRTAQSMVLHALRP